MFRRVDKCIPIFRIKQTLRVLSLDNGLKLQISVYLCFVFKVECQRCLCVFSQFTIIQFSMCYLENLIRSILPHKTLCRYLGRPLVALTVVWCAMAGPAAASTIASTHEATSDTIEIAEVEVSTSYKGTPLESLRPLANTAIYMRDIEQMRINDIKDLSAMIPNLHLPDYGSRMTSSVYVRGIGSRIDQPAMGLYVDGIPYFNKNGFDFQLADIRSISVLRGPQSTLYGRNTMGGVIDITTLSPMDYQGWRTRLEYGNGQTALARLAYYHRTDNHAAYTIGGYASHSDGFFTNEATGRDCDWNNNLGLTARQEFRTDRNLTISNSILVDWVNQGGYPYRQIDTTTHTLQPIAYNDPCGYHRFTVRDGLALAWQSERMKWNASTSYQYLDDEMTMDQDFTTRSMFTLQQAQQEHALNQDIVVRSLQPITLGIAGQPIVWNTLSGANIWGRHNKMQAPVTFKTDGIQHLILDNANHGIHSALGNHVNLSIEEQSFPIHSDFTTVSGGVAIYHHSSFDIGEHWQTAAGLRIEQEWQYFDYHSHARIHYLLTPYITSPRALTTQMSGTERTQFLEISPSFSLTHRANGHWMTHLSVSRGYKAGGFNTQLFSDLLQQTMMRDMMKDMGVTMVGSAVQTADVITYKPEYSWNYELGGKLRTQHLQAEVSLFYIDCRDQQLTVFPAGMQTGRMMTNAGRTVSYGTEISLHFQTGDLALDANYGYTHATFKQYRSGTANYRGNHLPYAPQHTLMLAADYQLNLNPHGDNSLLFHADWRGTGDIYWDDANLIRQDFYGVLNASVEYRWLQYGVKIWGKNLTDTDYNTFYFVSMQNHFLQQGKPLQMGISLTANF